MPSIDDFRRALRSKFREAELRGLANIEINSGWLHRKLGGYPGSGHQMPSCCKAMYGERQPGDEIIAQPPKGNGASLTIRYRLRRSSTSVSAAPADEKPRVGLVKDRIRAGPQIIDRDSRSMKVAGYDFQFVCDIKPQRNPDGTVKRFMPQSRYENSENLPLHKYGKGPFCKFGIQSQHELSGVYIFSLDGNIHYVGECERFSSRFNMGYGNISPRNCFEGGQQQNCRLNNLIYLAATAHRTVSLWFFQTADYKKVELELRRNRRPPWNRV